MEFATPAERLQALARLFAAALLDDRESSALDAEPPAKTDLPSVAESSSLIRTLSLRRTA